MSYSHVVKAAASDMEQHGYDSDDRIRRWQEAIAIAFLLLLLSGKSKKNKIKSVLQAEYDRMLKPGALAKTHKGMPGPYLSPSLHSELERRVLATENLIEDSHKMLLAQIKVRFEGWATSIPAVKGQQRTTPVEVKALEKSLNLKPHDGRILDDQKGKLKENINAMIAIDNKALAAIWHSRWRVPGYRYREEHKERDEVIYIFRDNWAIHEGIMEQIGPYTDEITAPQQEINCKCHYTFIYRISDLPEFLLTEYGKELLDIRA